MDVLMQMQQWIDPKQPLTYLAQVMSSALPRDLAKLQSYLVLYNLCIICMYNMYNMSHKMRIFPWFLHIK